jgi:regulation of enolase protein 1 (concanavalin A-like superfamily)
MESSVANYTTAPLTAFDDPRLEWLNEPSSWGVKASCDDEGYGGSHAVQPSKLVLTPPSKKDFWRRTFYQPTMIKGDASALLCRVPSDEEITLEVSFSFTPKEQFDQCGVLVYLDESHWLKAGIEFADGEPRMSCVVCNVFSDWSVMPWKGTAARLRIHKVNSGSSVLVECNTTDGADDAWQFVRICHLSARMGSRGGLNYPSGGEEPHAAGSTEESAWRVGPFGACSLQQRGCVCTFDQIRVSKPVESTHEAEGNDFGTM